MLDLQILLFYQLQNGNVRIPAILLALIGFFAYRATVGRPIMWCSERIAFCAACAVRYVLYVFLWPARTVRSLLRRLCSRAITAIRKRKRISYTKRLLSKPSFEGLGDGRTKKRREHLDFFFACRYNDSNEKPRRFPMLSNRFYSATRAYSTLTDHVPAPYMRRSISTI